MQLVLNYKLLKKPKTVLLTTACLVIVYNILIYFHPSNQGWIGSDNFSWENLVRFILIEQFLIEIITTIAMFTIIWYYARWRKLFNLELTPKAISTYLLKFLPPFLVAFFLFNPFTQTARFFLNEMEALTLDVYLNTYLLNFNLYFVYLIPVFLGGYGILTANLIQLYHRQLTQANQDIEELKAPPKYTTKLVTHDDWGEVPVETHQVLWFEKEGRKYFAQTRKNRLRTRETLTELESLLDPDKFVRINRSVIVNVRAILNYSFWENEKYILRLNDDKKTEFIMSRDRLKKVKSQLQLN